MGGWTRIWVVVTVLAGAAAVVNYVDAVRNAERQATTAYQQALSAYDDCRNSPPQPAPSSPRVQSRPGDTGPVSDLVSTLEAAVAATCDFARQPRAEYAAQQAQQRDDSIATVKGGALSVSALIVAWVSGTVGALFFAVGWIRRGFRKKRPG